MLIEDLYDVYYYVDGNHIGSSGQNTEEVIIKKSCLCDRPFTTFYKQIQINSKLCYV